ncbi:MAG: hypothetical protein WC375_00305 [Methanomassiliicoccales archaeon]
MKYLKSSNTTKYFCIMNSQDINEQDDKILLELAIFHETMGLKVITSEENIQSRLNEFKKRIANGGVTLEDLAIMVYKKYGDKKYGDKK